MQTKVLLPKHILIVDDSEDSRDLLKMYLEAQGMRVQCAPDGREALAILDAATELPDFILLDAHMPIMDGPEFRKKQLANNRIKHIPVVVISGDDDQALQETMKAPAHILAKPLQLGQLLTCL